MKVTTDACIFGALADFSGHTNILDIGAGTGLLALMLAQKSPESTLFTAAEINPTAIEELTQNCKNSPWNRQITCIHTDIKDYANHPENTLRFDGIISNPPFFRADLKSPSLQRSLVRHEDNSLSMTSLFDCIVKLLSPQGKACSLYPFRRFEEYTNLLPDFGLYLHKITRICNRAEKEPHLFIAEIHKYPPSAPLAENTFYIREENAYSPQMQEIVTRYYA